MLTTEGVDDLKKIISAISAVNPWSATTDDLKKLKGALADRGIGASVCHCPDWEFHLWILRLIQRAEPLDSIREAVGDADGLEQLVEHASNSSLRERKRALAVLTRLRGISLRVASQGLHCSVASIRKYWDIYRDHGVEKLFGQKYAAAPRMAQREDVRKAIFSVLHSPPSEFDINRTTCGASRRDPRIGWSGGPNGFQPISSPPGFPPG
jgi:hypothetical protein